MKKAIITVGVSASGKSTFARDLLRKHNCQLTAGGAVAKFGGGEVWVEANRDHIRFDYKTPDWTKYKFKKSKEDEVTSIQRSMVEDAAEQGHNIIISDTNLNEKYRQQWINFLLSYDYNIEVKEFPITWEEAVKRNAQREAGVTTTILYRQWQQWLVYLASERLLHRWSENSVCISATGTDHKFYTPNWSDPKAFICDIDGTVAQMQGRSPYDWDKVGTDKVRDQVLDMVLGLDMMGYTPIYLSGRDGICEYDTLTWLEQNGFPVKEEHFFIRKAGDSRKDTIIKQEIFWNHIADNFNVQIAIDDRPCVVSMWNDIGIPCVMAVADQRNWF